MPSSAAGARGGAGCLAQALERRETIPAGAGPGARETRLRLLYRNSEATPSQLTLASRPTDQGDARDDDERAGVDDQCRQVLGDDHGLGATSLDLPSQAGHDAYYISRVAATAMIFAPCERGISHNEAENMTLDEAEPSVNVLLHCVLARANR